MHHPVLSVVIIENKAVILFGYIAVFMPVSPLFPVTLSSIHFCCVPAHSAIWAVTSVLSWQNKQCIKWKHYIQRKKERKRRTQMTARIREFCKAVLYKLFIYLTHCLSPVFVFHHRWDVGMIRGCGCRKRTNQLCARSVVFHVAAKCPMSANLVGYWRSHDVFREGPSLHILLLVYNASVQCCVSHICVETSRCRKSLAPQAIALHYNTLCP